MTGVDYLATLTPRPVAREWGPRGPRAGRTTVEAVLAVRSGVEASDWTDAIRLAAAPLLHVGAVSAQYVDRCVDMVEQEGPFILVSPDIAVAHAHPEDGASDLALSLVRLAHPIPFGHSHGDPVRLVFVFATPRGRRHDVTLGRLARALMNGAGAQLEAARTDAEASRILEEAILVDEASPC